MLKPVPAKAVDHIEAFYFLAAADDRHCVRCHFIKSRPRMSDSQFRKDRQPFGRNRSQLFEQVPAHRKIKTGRLVRIRHPEENSGSLSMEIKRRGEIDHHYSIRWSCRLSWFCRFGNRLGDEYVTTIRRYRNIETGHQPDLARVRTRGVDDTARRDISPRSFDF